MPRKAAAKKGTIVEETPLTGQENAENGEVVVGKSTTKKTKKGAAAANATAAAVTEEKSVDPEEGSGGGTTKKPAKKSAKTTKKVAAAESIPEEVPKPQTKKKIAPKAEISNEETTAAAAAEPAKPKGRSKKNKAEEDKSAAASQNEVVAKKPAAKGRKKAEAAVINEDTEEIVAEEKPKPSGRGRKNTAAKENTVSAEVASKPAASKRGKKLEVPQSDEIPAVVKEEPPSMIETKERKGKAAAGGGRKKNVKQERQEEIAQPNENLETIEPDVIKEEPNAVESKAKKGKVAAAGGRKKKTPINVENETEELPSSSLAVAENTEPLAENSSKARGRKRGAAKQKEDPQEDQEVAAKQPKSRKVITKKTAASKESNGTAGGAGAGLMNSIDTDYKLSDFDLAANDTEMSSDEKPYNLKISSWNVAGLRSWLKKDGLKFLEFEQPDIFCIQETKCTTDQLPDEARINGYHPYWLCMPGGYAGVAVYSKIMPIHVQYGIGDKEFDDNGRMITAEYEKFYLINVYVPNSGRGLVNLEARMRWEKLFQAYVKKLDALKPLIICGDMNCSHNEIDLANPKTNTKSAGFTKEEREKMTELLSLGFIDTFRHLYPNKTGAYTYWTYMSNARARNVGWRLDYFIVSERFIKRVVDNCIRSQVKGSDHCPITLFLKA